jgi:hypothetical protein
VFDPSLPGGLFLPAISLPPAGPVFLPDPCFPAGGLFRVTDESSTWSSGFLPVPDVLGPVFLGPAPAVWTGPTLMAFAPVPAGLPAVVEALPFPPFGLVPVAPAGPWTLAGPVLLVAVGLDLFVADEGAVLFFIPMTIGPLGFVAADPVEPSGRATGAGRLPVGVGRWAAGFGVIGLGLCATVGAGAGRCWTAGEAGRGAAGVGRATGGAGRGEGATGRGAVIAGRGVGAAGRWAAGRWAGCGPAAATEPVRATAATASRKMKRRIGWLREHCRGEDCEPNSPTQASRPPGFGSDFNSSGRASLHLPRGPAVSSSSAMSFWKSARDRSGERLGSAVSRPNERQRPQGFFSPISASSFLKSARSRNGARSSSCAA